MAVLFEDGSGVTPALVVGVTPEEGVVGSGRETNLNARTGIPLDVLPRNVVT